MSLRPPWQTELRFGRALGTVCAFAFVAAIVPAQFVTEDPTLGAAPPILRKALQEGRHLCYIGRRVVEFRQKGVPSRHEEIITRRGDLVRIDFPEDSPQAGQVIVENKQERQHYFPDKNEIQILPPRHEEALERLRRILNQADQKFSLTTAPGQMVANLRTEQLVVSDHEGNVVQRLFIDPQTGMILRRQFFDPVGTPAGGFEFTQIQYSPRIDADQFTIHRKGAVYVTPAELLDRLARHAGFVPLTLPVSSGFRLEGSNLRRIESAEVLMQTYSGRHGHHLSLFQLKAALSPDQLRRFAQRQGFQFVYWSSSGYTYVVMGSITTAELIEVAGPISGGAAIAG